jgi:pimeloyl-ACP methyl ester carboxylesterase
MSASCPEVDELAAQARMLRVGRAEGDADGADGIVFRLWEPPGAAGQALPTLLLLHGSFGSWTHWLRNIPSLSERYRVIAIDIPGFGDSGPAPADHDPPGMASALWHGWSQLCDPEAGVIPAGRAPVFIAGFSLGAVYAGWLMRCFLNQSSVEPLYPAGLILLAAGGLGLRDRAPPPVSPIRKDEVSSGDEGNREVHRRNLEALMFANTALIDETALIIQDANVSRARFRRGFTSRPDWLCQALSGIALPVLGVWGSNDALDADVTLRLRALQSRVPHADVHVVQGAGHWVGYESFEDVNLILKKWIACKSNMRNYNDSQ